MANSLSELGVPQAKSAIILRILTALPSKYASFRMAWDSVAKAEQTLENLHIRLKNLDLMHNPSSSEPDSQAPSNVAFAAGPGHKEQHRHGGGGGKNKSGNNGNQAQNSNSNQKRKGNCNYCSKPGHWARECRSRIRDGLCWRSKRPKVNIGIRRFPGGKSHLMGSPEARGGIIIINRSRVHSRGVWCTRRNVVASFPEGAGITTGPHPRLRGQHECNTTC